MRILTVVRNLDYRGTQRTAQDFSLAYRQLGCDVAVLARESGGPREPILREAGIPVWIGGDSLHAMLNNVRAFRPDIVHIHREGLANAAESALMQTLKTADNRILETNVFGRFDPSPGARNIDVHLQISRWNLHRWRRWCPPLQTLPGALVPNPVDVDIFDRVDTAATHEFRRSLDLPDGAFVCGRIGNWDPMAFTAFEKLLTVDSSALMLCVLDLPGIQERVSALPAAVRQRIKLLPRFNDNRALATFYSSIDCLLHASTIGETFGLVIAEAMACGCPVVTAAVPHKGNAQAEIVGHLRGGVVAGSMTALPAALAYFRAHSALWPRLQHEARDSIRRRFSRSSVAQTALCIADIALGCGDRHTLRERLQNAPGLVTDVSSTEIAELLGNTIHGPSTRERLLMQLVNRHDTYRAYRLMLDTVRRRRDITRRHKT